MGKQHIFFILLVFVTYIFTDPWPQSSQRWWRIRCRERDKTDHLCYWGASYVCRIPEAEICICVCDVRPSAACIKVTVVKASYRGRMKKGMRLTGATNTPSARLVGLLTLPQDDICLKCWGVYATLHLFVKAACFELCELCLYLTSFENPSLMYPKCGWQLLWLRWPCQSHCFLNLSTFSAFSQPSIHDLSVMDGRYWVAFS